MTFKLEQPARSVNAAKKQLSDLFDEAWKYDLRTECIQCPVQKKNKNSSSGQFKEQFREE